MDNNINDNQKSQLFQEKYGDINQYLTEQGYANIGLKDYLSQSRTQKRAFKFKVFQLIDQIGYAFQRFWRGYDDREVFEFSEMFLSRNLAILKSFKKNNIGIWYDLQTQQFSEENTNLHLQNLIDLLTRCNENSIYYFPFNENDNPFDQYDQLFFTTIDQEVNNNIQKFLELLSQDFYNLWI